MNEIFPILKDSLSQVFQTLLNFPPKLLTTIIIILIGWFVSKKIGGLIGKGMERLGVNSLLDKTGLSYGLKQANIQLTLSDFIGKTLQGLIFLYFLLPALEVLGVNSLVDTVKDIIAYFPKFASALITLIGGILLAQFLAKITQAAFASMGIEFHEALGNAVRLLLVSIVAIIALGQAGIEVSLLNDTFKYLVIVIAAGLALAFALGGQKVAHNALAGYYARDIFAPGDILLIDGEEGELQAIGALNSEILVGTHKLVIPNSYLTENRNTIIRKAS
jgi:hypothetical protein